LGFRLHIVDFVVEPRDGQQELPRAQRYPWGDKVHGYLRRRYVELPQICTQAKELPAQVNWGPGFVAVWRWFGCPGASGGSVASLGPMGEGPSFGRGEGRAVTS